MVVVRHRLGAPLTLPPGTYDLLAGLYAVGADGAPVTYTAGGQARVVVGSVVVTTPDFPAPTAHPVAGYFEGGWRLRGYDWDTTLAAPRVMLHWERGREEATITVDGEATTVPALSSIQLQPASLTPAIGLVNADGMPLRRLGPWGIHWGESVHLSGPEEGDRYVLLGGAMVLSHIEARPAGEVASGDSLQVDVAFLSMRPLLEDDVVKIDLIGEGWAWRAQSDHIPATGAIPTLKWLWGSRVTDRHALVIPADALAGSAWAEMIVYDHFTGERLPILDSELAEQGIAIPLGSWLVSPP